MVIIEICIGSSCYVRGANNVVEYVNTWIEQFQWEEKVKVKGAFCMGLCSQGLGVKINGQAVSGLGLHNIDTLLLPLIQQELN
jgi:NADH:ubiquinone oxidoreductase subunit E